MHFGLAPLNARRDIAALGIIHRAILGKGPAQFRKWFHLDATGKRSSTRLGCRHGRQIQEFWGDRDYLNRSIFGYTWVYNLLPERVVSCTSVKEFQNSCQEMLKCLADADFSEWATTFSPRCSRNASLFRCVC